MSRGGPAFGTMGTDKDSIQQFNYDGQIKLNNIDEHDVVGLEREIDYIIRNSYLGSNSPLRNGTAQPLNPNGDYDPNIVNIQNGKDVTGGLPNQKRHRTAGHGTR